MSLLVAVMVLGAGVAASVGTAVLMRRGPGPVQPGGALGTVEPPERGPGRPFRNTIEPPVPADLRRDVQARVDEAEMGADRFLVEQYLRDVCDLVAADEVVYWEWNEKREALRPWAWSTLGADRPMHFQMGEWGPLVQWAAQERLLQTAGRDPSFPQIAVAPVVNDERLYGVLSAAGDSGISIGKAALREWIPRHAAHLSLLFAQFERRRGYGRSMRQGQALLQATEQVRGHKSPEALTAALCATAIEVTSANEAALVRWDAVSGIGHVQYATPHLGVKRGFAIATDSLVARTCIDGLPVVLEDAAPLQGDDLFGAGDRFRGAGSAAIIPIVREDVCIGAMVITAAEAGTISHDEARNVGLLAAVAGSSLDIIWEIEEVDRRSRTDALTGLANRRQFEEELQRIMAETDRFGGAASLVLVDIDHFKRVNDTHGHQAGDQVLRGVAGVLAGGVRTVDVCARYGGEEMAILLPQTSIAGARELAERLRQAVEQLAAEIAGEPVRVTASFGVASYPETVAVRDSLFPAADQALYAAKRDGRNCVRSAGRNLDGP